MNLSSIKSRKNAVQRLSEDLQSYLRSGVAITSPCQCVEELVLNAIDAKATCIAVRLDLQYFKIQVVDNGIGICPEDLEILGERYTTNKCRSLEDLNNIKFYGFRGEALASIKQIAGVLEIVTRSTSSDKTYCKLFLHGKNTQLTTSVFPRPSHGTTVTAYDFMYNLPIRKKSINNTLDVEQIRSRLEAIALVHPEISLTFRNDATQTKYLQTMKCNSVLSVFSQLFGSKKASSLQSVRNTLGPFTIEGFISVNTSCSKALQFLYINKRLVLKTKIHKLINTIISKCLASKLRSNFPPVLNENPKSIENRKCSIFILNISCPPNEYDICLDPSKTLVEFKDWSTVLKCVHLTLVDFLKKENLLKPDCTELNFAFIEASENSDSKESSSTKDGLIDLKEKDGGKLKKGMFSLLAKRNINHSCSGTEAVTFLEQCTEDFGDNLLEPKGSLTNNESKAIENNINNDIQQQNDSEKRKAVNAEEIDTSKKIKIVLKPNEGIMPVSSLQEFKNLLLKEGKLAKHSKFKPDNNHTEQNQGNFLKKWQDFDKSKIMPYESRNNCNIKNQNNFPKKNNIIKHRPKMPITSSFANKNKKTNNLKKLIKRKNCLTAVSNLQKFTFKINQPSKESKSKISSESEMNESSVVLNSTNCNTKANLSLIKLHSDDHITAKNKETLCVFNISSNGYKELERTNCEFPLCDNRKLYEKMHQQNKQKFLTSSSLIETAQDKLPINCAADGSDHQLIGLEKTTSNNKTYIQVSDLFPLSSKFCSSSDLAFPPPCNNIETVCNSSQPFESNNYTENDDRLTPKSFDLKESPDSFLPNSTYTPDQFLYQNICHNNQLSETQAFIPHNESCSLSDAETLPFISSNNCSDDDLNDRTKLESQISQSTQNLSNQEKLQFSFTEINKPFCNRRKESLTLQKYSEEFERFCTKLSENLKTSNYLMKKNKEKYSEHKNSYIFQSGGFETIYLSPEKPVSPSDKKCHKVYNNISNLTEKEYDDNFSCDLTKIKDNEIVKSNNNEINENEDFNALDLMNNEIHETKFIMSDSYPSAAQPPKQCEAEMQNQEIHHNDYGVESSPFNFSSILDTNDEFEFNVNKRNSSCKNDPKLNNEYCSSEAKKLEADQTNCTKKTINDEITIVDEISSVQNYMTKPNDQIYNTENKATNENANNDFRTSSENNNSTTFTKQLTNDEIDSADDINKIKESLMETIDKICDTEKLTSNIENSAEFTVYSENRSWICHEDKVTGQQIYIHRKMGNSSFLPPPSEKDNNKENIIFSETAFLLGNIAKPFLNKEVNSDARKALPPSLFSHLVNLANDLQDDEATANVKWKGEDKPEFTSNEMVDKFLNWQNPIMEVQTEEVIENVCVQETWRSSIKAYNIIHPYKFKKNIFENYNVLNQVDNKFIACVVNMSQTNLSAKPGLIVLFDQHAVHERIRLEHLMIDLHQNENADDFQLNSVKLIPPTDITLDPGKVRIAFSFAKVFNKLGVELHPHPTNRNKMIIHSVPKCLAKNELSKNQSQQPIDFLLIEKLLDDVIMMLEQTKGANYVLPKTLINILNSQACHGAVKFGDKLNFKTCCMLLNQLKGCLLPFQCAHGRPSVIPLVDLDLFKKSYEKQQESRPKLWKLRKCIQDGNLS